MIHPLVVEMVLAAPNPTPEQPPGTEGITTMLNWLAWAAIVGDLAGFLGCAAKLGIAAFTGRATEAGIGLVIAVVASIIAAGAGTILQAVV